MQTPLYQGTQYNPARPPQAESPVQHPFAQQFHASNQALIQNARNLELAIQERQEYTLEQNRSAALQEAFHSMNMEMLQALQIEDGMEGSLFDSNGLLNQEAVDEIKQKYLAVADNWTSGFTSDQGMRSAAEAQNKYRASVNEAIDSKILASLKPRAQAALDRNIKAAIMRGQHGDARKYVYNSEDRNLLSKEDAFMLETNINLDEWKQRIDNTDDADELYHMLHNPYNQDIFNSEPYTEIPNIIQRKLDSLLKTKGSPSQIIPTNVNGKLTATRTAPKAPPAAGGWVRSTIEWFADTTAKHDAARVTNQYLSDTATIDQQKRRIALFRDFVYSHKDFNSDFMLEADNIAQSLEVDKETRNRIIKERQEELELKLITFNPRSTADQLYKSMVLSQQKEKDAAPDWAYAYESQAQLVKAALDLAVMDYNVWLEDIGNKDKNVVEKARTFQNFLQKRKTDEIAAREAFAWGHMPIDYFFKKYRAFDNSTRAAQTLEKNAMTQRSKKFAEEYPAYVTWRKDRDAYYKEVLNDIKAYKDYYSADAQGARARAMINEALIDQKDTVSFESHVGDLSLATSLPDSKDKLIIYVPSSNSPVNPEDQPAILVPTEKDLFRVEFVTSDQIDAPVPSILLQQSLLKYGRLFNTISFKNNVLSLDYKNTAETVHPFLYPTDSLGRPVGPNGEIINQDNATIYTTTGPDDALNPPETTGELEI